MRRSSSSRSCTWWKSRMKSCRLKLRPWKLLKLGMLKRYWLTYRANRLLSKNSCIKIPQMSRWSNQASRSLKAGNLLINQFTASLKLHSDRLSLEHQNKRYQQLRLRSKLIYSWKTSIDIPLRWWCLSNIILKWWGNSSKHRLNKLWCTTNSNKLTQACCTRCSRHLIILAWWVICNRPLKIQVWCNRGLLTLSNNECLHRFLRANKCSQGWWDNPWCRGQTWCKDLLCLSNKWCNNKCLSSRLCNSNRWRSNSLLRCKWCLSNKWCLNHITHHIEAVHLLLVSSRCHLLRSTTLISRHLLNLLMMAKPLLPRLTWTVTMYPIAQISIIHNSIYH